MHTRIWHTSIKFELWEKNFFRFFMRAIHPATERGVSVGLQWKRGRLRAVRYDTMYHMLYSG